MKITNTAGVGKINKANVYTGTCTDLAPLRIDSLNNPADASFNIVISNTVSTTYYIKLVNKGGSVSFNQTMATSVNIVGQVGFCPGSTIVLGAQPINVNGTPTYTWLPGGANTFTTSFTPLGTTTYTLIYTDSGGTLTQTTSVFPLNADQCKDCEMVQNGHFEWFQKAPAYWGNIMSPTGISDVLYWYSPTGASPDYYNAASSVLSNSVPVNDFTNNIPAHSGAAYVGLYTFVDQQNYREYIQSELVCPLETGQKYRVKFYAILPDFIAKATNVDAHLSVTAISNHPNTTNFTVTPHTNSGIVTHTWTTVTGIITGNSEQYITIGNFNDDVTTNTVLTTGLYTGESYYFIDDVSVTPIPPVLSASCSPTSYTLAASGAATNYTRWTDGVNTYSGTVVSIPTPTASVTYTCIVDLPCANCSDITETITVIPSPTVSVGSATICSGNSTILTASGATAYSWNTGATTNTISVTPSVTTTYTVTGSNGTCSNTKTATVTVNATPTVAVTNVTMCAGQTKTLTASGATAYVWNTGATTATISVSPASITIYTVTGTTNGCSNAKTVSITVTPNPTVSVNNNTIMCAGQTRVLTASGASTYSWIPGSMTSASVSVSPTSTTIYSVTGTTNNCTNTKTVSITVNPNPTVTAIANPTSICSGQSSTLTAGGATTYSWSTGSTNTVITVSPVSTTAYTATGYYATGCSATKTVVVLVGPSTPTIIANSSSVAVCAGGTTTLTATGAINYTWSPVGINTATALVSPSVATVYTLSGSSGSGCNTATASILVNPVISTLCCSASNTTIGTSLTSSVTIAADNYNAPGTVIDVQGVITFTGNTSFTGYTFRMAKGAKLIVLGDVTLAFTNCKLYSCTELWDGIYFPNHLGKIGSIALSGTSIEDMYNGIVMDYENNTVITSAGIYMGRVIINNSVLNKNYIAVQMKNAPGTSPSGNTYTLSLTSSTISSNASNTSPGSTLKPSSTYTYAYNNIVNGTMGSSAPYLNFPRTYTGIYLENLGTTSSVIIGDKTNASNTNTFDNLDLGIHATETQLNIHNNYFKNLTGSLKQGDVGTFPATYPASGPDEIGIGVLATHTTIDTYTVAVGSHTVLPTSSPYPLGNKFEDCNRGVKAINCNRVYARANTFTATSTSTLVFTTIGNPPFQLIVSNPNTYYPYNAQSAIFASGVGYVTDASYNYIRNYSSGIYVNYTSNNVNGTAVKCYTNNIAAPSASGYCMQAIQIDQTGGYTANDVVVRSNTISAVYKGIAGNSVKTQLRIEQNNISIESTAKALGYSNSSQRTGVILNYCDYAAVLGNIITSNASPTPSTNATAEYLTGVHLTNSTNGNIECNNTSALGRCFVFQQGCSGSRWLVNDMSNSYRGLDMRINAVMGNQGANTGSPNLSANTWANITQETYAFASNNVNNTSKLYVKSGAGTEPTLNYSSGGSINPYGVGLGGINVTTGTSYTCNAGSAQRVINADNNNSVTAGGNAMRTTEQADTLALYTMLATQNEAAYEVFPQESDFTTKQSVYQLLYNDSIKAVEGTVLANFYRQQQNSAIGGLTKAQRAINSNDAVQALTLNAAVSAATTVEYKHQRANELLIKYMQAHHDNLSVEEKQDLYSMANECIAKGAYVTLCRNVVNALEKNSIHYNDNCDDVANANRKAKTEAIVKTESTHFNLHPNPNNGTMVLEYNLGADNEAKFNLFDITGKLILSKDMEMSEGSLFINEQNLKNGVYFYTILVGERTIKTDKVVIIK